MANRWADAAEGGLAAAQIARIERWRDSSSQGTATSWPASNSERTASAETTAGPPLAIVAALMAVVEPSSMATVARRP
jgi:hypothetical protein